MFLPAAAVFPCEPVHSQYVLHMCEASQLSWSIGRNTGNLLCPSENRCTMSTSTKQWHGQNDVVTCGLRQAGRQGSDCRG